MAMCNSNAIIVHPMPNWEAYTIASTLHSICNMMDKKQEKTQFYVLDNAASSTIKTFLLNKSINYKFVPPKED